MTFDTLLVANRGEIARRIIRTAIRLGLRTVAVYSDADRAAPHVRDADHAVPSRARARRASRTCAPTRSSRRRLANGAGGDPPRLRIPFRERRFARAVEAAGIASSGPTPDQIDAFGAKHTARALAEPRGRAAARGHRAAASRRRCGRAADAHRLPVMLKATGGGGGIGMRACHERRRGARGPSPGSPRSPQRELRVGRSVPGAAGRARRATSRCRSSATAKDGSPSSATATARCSAATRR